MEAAMVTPNGRADVGRIEHEIAQVRDDLGRTVAAIGARLTPAHLMNRAKRSLRDTTMGTTRAVAQSATEMAGNVASRTREAALGARDQLQTHPYAASAIGAGISVGYWLATSAMRSRRRLAPRQWDEPFDRSNRRRAKEPHASTVTRALPLAAAAIAAFVVWRTRT
jgi:ElaB/YqjD/DUF883 family membrane-anchored ribosome-binding protein